MAALPEIHVIAGALFDAAGRVLIAQRPRGRHMAGRWEFPGGKLAFGEDRLKGLKRELAEELGITVRSARPLIRLHHNYSDRRVLLDFWRVIEYEGTPEGLDSQALAWVTADELPGHDMLEADRGIVTALRLPQLARVISTAAQLAALGEGEPQTIFWHVAEPPSPQLDAAIVKIARAAGHRIFALGDGVEAISVAAKAGADGAVLRWHGQNLHVDRDSAFLVGVICEDRARALEAIGEGAHFLVVATQRGPLPLGDLEELCQAVSVPVFAGWYPDAGHLERLQLAGAYGCAVIMTKRTGQAPD
jgi:8-oxo-dGTP diphosphatase